MPRTTAVIVLKHGALTERVIGIEVHRTVGPGLLESVYRECLCLEVEHAGIAFASEAPVPVVYEGTTVKLGFRADLLIEETVIVDVKAVAALLPAHEAHVLTYLKMSGLRVGLLMNFHARLLKDGLVRFVV